MDLGKLLNDPTQEVIHRRLSDDIGLIWAEARSFSRPPSEVCVGEIRKGVSFTLWVLEFW